MLLKPLFFLLSGGLRSTRLSSTRLRSTRDDVQAALAAVTRIGELQKALATDPSVAAELKDLELAHPSAALHAMLLRRAEDAETDRERWKYEKLAEADLSVLKAANVLVGDREDGWKPLAGAVAELGYWTLLGNAVAETMLLETLRSDDADWIKTEADAALRKAWAIPASTEASQRLDAARAALVAGDAKLALNLYVDITETLVPDFADGWRKRAQVLHLALGRPDDAIVAYRRAIQCNPNNYVALLDFGTLLLRQNQLDEAVTTLQRAATLNPALNDTVTSLLN